MPLALLAHKRDAVAACSPCDDRCFGLHKSGAAPGAKHSARGGMLVSFVPYRACRASLAVKLGASWKEVETRRATCGGVLPARYAGADLELRAKTSAALSIRSGSQTWVWIARQTI